MAHLAGRKTIDMTTGPLFRKLLIFVLPLMATNLLQIFYNAADIMIVGLSSEPDGVGAVGSTSAFLSLVVNLFIGLSVGMDVVVARYIGAKDDVNISKAVHTSLCMGLIFGVAGGALGFVISRPVLIAMGYTDNLLELGVRYSLIYFGCLPMLSLANSLSAIFRAMGDTRTPLYVMLGTGALNVCLNLFFVLVVGLSVEGVAIATAIANVTTSVVLWGILARQDGACKIVWKELKISWPLFREIFHIGFPAGIQSAFFSLSNMLIQSSVLQVSNALTPVGSPYAPVIKGNSAAQSLESFVFTALNAVTQAASTFTSQNMGKKDYQRVRRVLWTVSLMASGVAVLLSGLIIVLRDPLLVLYDVQKADDVLSMLAYDTAIKRVWWKWTSFILFGLMNSAAGVLRGMGKSTTSAAISLVGTCIFRVAWIYTVFRWLGTLEVIYISYGISWLLTGAAFYICVGMILRMYIRGGTEINAVQES